MKRGELWTASGGPDYAGKPRPVVLLQDDRFMGTASITVCPLTTSSAHALTARPIVRPTAGNGLALPCRLMVDKITTLSKRKLGARIGVLDDPDIVRLNRAVIVFLGLAG